MMASGLEIGANAVNALSIVLAARNSVHTWWTGIVGCALFGAVFFLSRLYADTLLQVFFIGTSAVG
jgi:nicotinamide mononucleotide transporter